MLSDPASVPYTPDIHEALKDSIPFLKQLLNKPFSVASNDVPAKQWIEATKANLKRGVVPFSGDLSYRDQAKLTNWFDIHIGDKDPVARFDWIGNLLPFAHAITLYIASKLRNDPQSIAESLEDELEDRDQPLIQRAWNIQQTKQLPQFSDHDVELECLEQLEEQMFERSALAGVAGNRQWGLDAGDHQDCWNPYAELPQEWDHQDRKSEDEGELRVSRNTRKT